MKWFNSFTRLTVFALLVAVIVSIAGCGGTKVYTADKTVVHRGSIYNLSNVNKVGTRVEAKTPSGDTVNMIGKDKKQVEAMLDEYDSMMVSTIFDLDQQEMVYQRVNIDSYRDYSKIIKNFESASGKLTKFMADKKKTQLEL